MLKGNAHVLLLLEAFLVATKVVALAILDALFDVPETLRGTAGPLLHNLGSVGESEAGEGCKVVEEEAALRGDALPDDGEDSA